MFNFLTRPINGIQTVQSINIQFRKVPDHDMFSIKLFLRSFKTELVPPLLDMVNNSHKRGESFSQTQLLSSQPNEMKASYNLLIR